MQLLVSICMVMFEVITSPFQTFRCMTFHRNLKMIHVDGKEHLITCKTCEKKKYQDLKNKFLTILYFNGGWWTAPFMIPVVIVSFIHIFITGRKGSFEHPPEHGRIPLF